MSWKVIIVLAAIVAGVIGYYIWNKTPDVPESSTFRGYTRSLTAAEQKAQAVLDADRFARVREAVEKYKMEKGEYPATLQDLVPQFMGQIPGGLAYDPSSGTVTQSP